MTTLRTRRTISYYTELICECGGEMVWNGTATKETGLLRPLFRHVCGRCGQVTAQRVIYPDIQMMTVNPEEPDVREADQYATTNGLDSSPDIG